MEKRKWNEMIRMILTLDGLDSCNDIDRNGLMYKVGMTVLFKRRRTEKVIMRLMNEFEMSDN